MKGVILAGGKGSRLVPITNSTPKPMISLLNRPFLEYLLAHLHSHGFDEIFLTMFHLSDSIVDYFGAAPQGKVSLTYAIESSPLGTAGGVKALEDNLKNTFVVCNGDIYTDLDLTEVLNFHWQKKAIATIVLTRVDDPSAYGMVETDRDGKILRFVEKPSPDQITTNWVNAGTYILEPEALRYAPDSVSLMFERDLFPTLLENLKPVYSYRSDAYWIDVGSPKNYKKLHDDILLGYAPDNFKNAPVSNGLTKGTECKFGGNFRSFGPVLVGNGCVIGENVELNGPLVIGDNCKLGAGVSISHSILLDGVSIGDGSKVTECVLGSRSCLREGSQISDGTIIPEDTVY